MEKFKANKLTVDEHNDDPERWRTIQNAKKATDSGALIVYSTSVDPAIKIAVARNAETLSTTLETLANFDDSRVVLAAVQNAGATDTVFKNALNNCNILPAQYPPLLLNIATHPNVTKERLNQVEAKLKVYEKSSHYKPETAKVIKDCVKKSRQKIQEREAPKGVPQRNGQRWQPTSLV